MPGLTPWCLWSPSKVQVGADKVKEPSDSGTWLSMAPRTVSGLRSGVCCPAGSSGLPKLLPFADVILSHSHTWFFILAVLGVTFLRHFSKLLRKTWHLKLLSNCRCTQKFLLPEPHFSGGHSSSQTPSSSTQSFVSSGDQWPTDHWVLTLHPHLGPATALTGVPTPLCPLPAALQKEAQC